MDLGAVSYKVWDTPDLLHLIKAELLEKEVYKKELDSSRLKNLYTGEREANNGLTIITAHKDNKIVGVITCEHSKFSVVPAITLKDPFRQNSKVKETENWNCLSLGFIGVYVIPGYRGLGLGGCLVREMEFERLNKIKHTSEDAPFFIAAEAAVKLVKHCSNYSYVSRTEEKTLWFHQSIHEITQAAKTNRYGESYYGDNAVIKNKLKALISKKNN